jgi:hypothetical protein
MHSAPDLPRRMLEYLLVRMRLLAVGPQRCTAAKNQRG